MRKILCVLLAVVFVWGSLPVSAETAESVSVSAYAAVLYEPVSGTVLFEKNSREVLPVASTTKIMTALLAFESEHRGDPVTITPEMISVEGSSMGLRAGEMLALGDIARGMMMASGNDGANAIALYLSDSTEAFSEKMNARAAELHMVQTHFSSRPRGSMPRGTAPRRMTWRCLPQKRCKMKSLPRRWGRRRFPCRLFRPKKPCGMKITIVY